MSVIFSFPVRLYCSFLTGFLSFPKSCLVSEAGIIILPSPQGPGEEQIVEEADAVERDSVSLKWPRKPGISENDLFDLEDSWYDPPPEGFSLTVSIVKITTSLHFDDMLLL